MSQSDPTAQTLTLADFLLARIAEDEEAARNAAVPIRRSALHGGGEVQPDDIYVRWWVNEGPSSLPEHGHHMEGTALHQRFDPDRVLAECEAKRRIVQSCQNAIIQRDAEGALARLMLDLLALPYADHPDCRDEWRL